MNDADLDTVAIAREALTRLGGHGAGTLLEAPRVVPLLPAFGQACVQMNVATRAWDGSVASALEVARAAVHYAEALQAIEQAAQVALAERAGGPPQ
jgi:hypothetical protein